jgi:hypothetical protein
MNLHCFIGNQERNLPKVTLYPEAQATATALERKQSRADSEILKVKFSPHARFNRRSRKGDRY